MTALQAFFSIAIGLALFGVSTGYASAPLNRCDLTVVTEAQNFDGDIQSAVDRMSRQLNLSIMAELPANFGKVHIPAGKVTLSAMVANLGPGLRARCEGNSVLHVFSPAALDSKANALNYKFRFFRVAANVDEFRSDLMVRLQDEPWKEMKPDTVIQSGQGALLDDRMSFPLKKEDLRDITARDLIFKIADQQRIASVLQLDISRSAPATAWSNSRWSFETIR